MVAETEKGARRRVVCDRIAVDSAPSRVLLVPWGNVESSQGHFLVDQEAADLVVAAFSERRVDIPIDYEHGTLGGEYAAPDGTAPAAAWIKSIEVVPGEGLFGTVEWTQRGRNLVVAKEYRYLSPVVQVRKSDGRVVELHSAAMTNKPAIVGMRAIANKADESPLVAENRMLRASLKAFHFEDAKRAFFPRQADGATPGNATRTIAASSGQSARYAPSPEEQRKDIIAASAAKYAREADGKLVLCSQVSWINQALRESGAPTLTANEVRDLGLREEPPASNKKPAFTRSVNAARAMVENLPLAEQRPAIIRDANAKFYADETIRRACSNRAWVDNSLREAGMQPMTETELRTYSILVND